MLWSQTHIPTSKDPPADATTLSHQLLLRAGFVRQISSGLFEPLPLSQLTFQKFQSLLHTNGLPNPHPSTQSRPDRPRHGLLHSKQFPALTFPNTPQHSQSLLTTLQQSGLSPTPDFLLPSPHGDTILVTSPNYSSPLDRAATGPRPHTFGGDPTAPLTKLHTPNTKSVPDLARLLNIHPSDILKTLVFRATPSSEWTAYPATENLTAPQWLIAVVRGDHDVNLHKLTAAAREHFHIQSLTLADQSSTDEFSFGYVGPDIAIRKLTALLVIDPDAAQNKPWTAGANEPDHHVQNFHWFRECGQPLADPRKVLVTDIRNATEGDPAPTGQGTLHLTPALRLATVSPDTLTLDLFRLLASLIESHHTEKGLLLPPTLSPYSILLTPVNYTDPAVKTAADNLHHQLTAANLEVLMDDRDLPPARKLADASLLNFPTRLTLGPRTLAQNSLELLTRSSPTQSIPIDQVLPTLTSQGPL